MALLKRFGTEFGGLTADGVHAWIDLLPQLLGLTLLGWSAYYGSVLMGAQLAVWSAWLVIVALSLGVTLRLATLIISLRLVAVHLGAPDLLRRVNPQDYIEDGRDQSLSRLLSITMLPFLALYASFGYINSFVQDVVMTSTKSVGMAGLVSDLNPIGSPIAIVAVSGAIVALFVGRRAVDKVFENRQNAFTGLLAVLLESAFLLLVALSGFRLVQSATLWFQDRALMQWFDTGIHMVSQLLHVDIPDVLAAIGGFLADIAWPVFWDVVSQPLAWLALTALVLGSRVLSLSELWRSEGPAQTEERRAAKLRARIAQAEGLRRVTLRAQEVFFGDLDDKYLPTWWAFRLVLRAGWIPLGVFVIAFNMLALAGDWLKVQVFRGMGGGSFTDSLLFAPLVGLIPDVAVLSLQLALLGAAFVRILNRSAGVVPQPRSIGGVAVLRGRRVAEFVLVVALLVGFTGISLLKPSDQMQQRTAAIGVETRLDNTLVRVDAVDYAQELRSGSDAAHSRAAFVVMRASVYAKHSASGMVGVELRNGARIYHVDGWGPISSLRAPLGFRESADMVFEVDPSDLNPGLSATFTTEAFLSGFHDVVRVPLGLPDNAASTVSSRVVTVDNRLRWEAP